MPPDHDALVSAIGRLESVTSTLTAEVSALRKFKDEVLPRCMEHAKDIASLQDLGGRNATALMVGDEWMRRVEAKMAGFSGGWKAIVLLSTAISGAVAIYAALKGII